MGRLPSEGFLQVEEKSKIVESEGDVTMKKKKCNVGFEDGKRSRNMDSLHKLKKARKQFLL